MAENQKNSLLEKLSPLLLVATIVLSFLVGVLWQKVENQGSSQVAEQESPISVDNLKKMAKSLNLDQNKFDSCLDSGEKSQKVVDDTNYGQTLGVSGTPGFFINGKFVGGAFPFASFKEIIDRELDGKGSTNYLSYSKDLQDAYNQAAFNPAIKDVNVQGSYSLGSDDAKVTLVEFSDFECPFCARHFSQTYPQLKSEYIDTGKLKYVFKHFPLSFHPNAQKASEAAECAGDQGKFWEMHDLIFQSQVNS